jgi:CubicO group peptidase (beta-lactamase class C family)
MPEPGGAGMRGAWPAASARERSSGREEVVLDDLARRPPGTDPNEHPHLAGGAFSTASDYANVLVMLLNGGQFRGRRVLSETAVKEMFRDQTAGRPLRFNLFQAFAGLHPGRRDVRYGICNWLERVDGPSGKTLEAGAERTPGHADPLVPIGRRRVHGLESHAPVPDGRDLQAALAECPFLQVLFLR